MLRYLSLLILILFLSTAQDGAAEDGRVGKTSTGTARISITILPKIEIKKNPNDPRNIKVTTNLSEGSFNKVTTISNEITTIVLEPK